MEVSHLFVTRRIMLGRIEMLHLLSHESPSSSKAVLEVLDHVQGRSSSKRMLTPFNAAKIWHAMQKLNGECVLVSHNGGMSAMSGFLAELVCNLEKQFHEKNSGRPSEVNLQGQ